MIRQAQSYLAGAASSAALIAAAIAAFVLLASLAAFRDWPLPNMSGTGDNVAPVAAGPSVAAQAAATQLVSATDFVAANAPVGPPLTASGIAGALAPAGPVGPAGPPSEPFNPRNPNPFDAGNRGTPIVPQPGPTTTSPTGSSGQSLSGGLNNTLNNTVGGVDNGLGGPLKGLGLDKTINDATTGLLGQGSAGGGVVDGVGGLLGGSGQKR